MIAAAVCCTSCTSCNSILSNVKLAFAITACVTDLVEDLDMCNKLDYLELDDELEVLVSLAKLTASEL